MSGTWYGVGVLKYDTWYTYSPARLLVGKVAKRERISGDCFERGRSEVIAYFRALEALDKNVLAVACSMKHGQTLIC